MNWKTIILATAGYILLTLVVTYPLVSHLNTHFIGEGEFGLFAWNLWWVEKTVTEKDASIFHTNYLYHPTGASLALRELSLANGLAGALLQGFVSLNTAYNILIILSFVLSGLGMFLLARYVTGSNTPSYLAGMLYAFSLYRLVEVSTGHLNLAATQWIPFHTLYLIKSHREGGRKNIISAGIFLALTSLTSWQYMGMAILFTILYAAYNLTLPQTRGKKGIMNIAYATILGLGATTPFLLPLLRELATGDYMKYSFTTFLGTSRNYSIDLASIFFSPVKLGLLEGVTGRIFPVGYTILFFILYFIHSEGKIGAWFRQTCNKIQKTTKGLLPLTLASTIFYALIIYYGMNKFYGGKISCYIQVFILITATIILLALAKARRISFWLLASAAYYIFSMGPTVNLFGETCEYPLPYILFYFMPGWSMFRAPYRFLAYFTLAAAIVFAKGLQRFCAKTPKKKLVLGVVFALILLEHGLNTYPLTDARIPEAYEVINSEQGDYAILEVPVPPVIRNDAGGREVYSLPAIAYYQTIHGKKIIGGYIERNPPEALEFIDTTAPFCQLRKPFRGEEKTQCNGEARARQLAEYNIRFIIVHEEWIRNLENTDSDTLSELSSVLDVLTEDALLAYDDGKIKVYKVG